MLLSRFYQETKLIATLSSVIRKRKPGILINIFLWGRYFYNQYDELNIIFFIEYMRLKKSAI